MKVKLNIRLVQLSLVFFITAVLSIDPPELPDSFQISFNQQLVKSGSTYYMYGQMFYDSVNNRQRVDRTNGYGDIFCSSILPNVSTSCTHLTVGKKRYIIYPQRRQCCFCCDSQHGCGILKKNWLEGATYLGPERLDYDDRMYNKWSKDGDFGYNFFWTTMDEDSIPRQLDQNGNHFTTYNLKTFEKKIFEDKFFAIPDYCISTCPSASICGKHQLDNKILQIDNK